MDMVKRKNPERVKIKNKSEELNMAKKKYGKRYYNRFTKNVLQNDLASTYPVGGKFLKVGNSEVLLTKSNRMDENGSPIYIGTVVKRHGITKRKVKRASHILIKPM